MNIDEESLIITTFIDAYKAGFDHGLKCDRQEIENINRTATSIRLFDYQFERYMMDAAERYVFNKQKGEPK